jgi:hypothetical protein
MPAEAAAMTALLIRRVGLIDDGEVWELVASRDGLPPYDRLAMGTREECSAEYDLAFERPVAPTDGPSDPITAEADTDPTEA